MSLLDHAPKALPTIKELFTRTWGTYKRRLGSILAVYALTALVVIVAAVLTGIITLPAVLFPPLLLLPALVIIAGTIIGGSISQSMSLEAAIHDGMTWKHAWEKAKEDWKSLWWVNFISGLVLYFAFFLFIVPGIILLPAFQVFPYVFKADGKKGFSALMNAHALVRGRWWKTAGRVILFVIAVGIIPMILEGLTPPMDELAKDFTWTTMDVAMTLLSLAYTFFLAGPLSLVFGAELYHDLKTTAAHVSDEQVKTDGKKWGWIAVGGLILFVAFFALMAGAVAPFMSEALSGM